MESEQAAVEELAQVVSASADRARLQSAPCVSCLTVSMANGHRRCVYVHGQAVGELEKEAARLQVALDVLSAATSARL